ncbi:hypothetical protein SUGI_0896190 [Cryptomeria japonica]|nr:hypothetical protein SUGI_0896190 [Cryptomeria japonica]
MDVEGRYLVTGEGQNNEPNLGWRSPAVGLFFGMASVLVLVGFAWLILVCIACKLVGANLGRGALQVNLESMASAHIKPEKTEDCNLTTRVALMHQ